jgi:hypothetical protein
VLNPYRRSLDSAGALGLALHYLGSAMPSIGLQLILALVPTTVSRYLNFSLSILLTTLRAMPESGIQWTEGQGFVEDNAVIIKRHPMLPFAFATVDGLRSPVEESSDPEIENATYNGWVHEHNVNSVFVSLLEVSLTSLHYTSSNLHMLRTDYLGIAQLSR